MPGYVYNELDRETAKKIDDFLPDKLFDAHMHISHYDSKRAGLNSFDTYYEDIKLFAKDRAVLCNGIIFPDAGLKNPDETDKAMGFLASELNKHPENFGEAIVFPGDSAEDIKKRIVHPRIRGLKCYLTYAERPDYPNADVGEYLPEAAWQIADERKMVITLHLAKEGLADANNLKYIIDMSKRYPDAVLILAHAARAFAAWTVFDTVDELAQCENVWFDFSAVCESPAMLYIIKRIGTERCMWGTDYPVPMKVGKPISLADGSYWITAKDIEFFSANKPIRTWSIITEELMALRQACVLADLNRSRVENIFFNNANSLFNR